MSTGICEDGTSPGSSVTPLPLRMEGLGQSTDLVLRCQKSQLFSWASWEQASVWEGICHALLSNCEVASLGTAR